MFLQNGSMQPRLHCAATQKIIVCSHITMKISNPTIFFHILRLFYLTDLYLVQPLLNNSCIGELPGVRV
jgi:hypothetical protein